MKTFKISLVTVTALVSFAGSAHAFDSRKCNSMLNKGTWKTYKYQGVGEGKESSTSQGTRQEGSFKTSSVSETESTTSSVDPGVTTNYSSSSGQYTSSTNECDSFALNTIREERDHFVVLNSEQLKKEIAQGHGEFLSVLDDYTLCNDDVIPLMHAQLRQGFDGIIDATPDGMSKKVMSIIGADAKLRATCDTI